MNNVYNEIKKIEYLNLNLTKMLDLLQSYNKVIWSKKGKINDTGKQFYSTFTEPLDQIPESKLRNRSLDSSRKNSPKRLSTGRNSTRKVSTRKVSPRKVSPNINPNMSGIGTVKDSVLLNSTEYPDYPDLNQYSTIDSSILKHGYKDSLKRTIFNFDPSPEERNTNYIRMRAVVNSAHYKMNDRSASRAELKEQFQEKSPSRDRFEPDEKEPVKFQTSPSVDKGLKNTEFIKAFHQGGNYMKLAKKKIDTNLRMYKKRKVVEKEISYDNLDDLKEGYNAGKMAGMALLTEFQYSMNLKAKDEAKQCKTYSIKDGDYFEYLRNGYN